MATPYRFAEICRIYVQICLMLWSLISTRTVVSSIKLTEIPPPTNSTLESVTVSSGYLWAIDSTEGVILQSSDDNVVYCVSDCANGEWIDVAGQLDQIDANDEEVWGVNDRNQVFKRSVDGGGGWIRITPTDPMNPDFGCGPVCFSDISISQGGYVWGVSKENNTVYMCHTSDCNGSNWVLISSEITLTQIDAGAEEVWGVNANNHIFRWPVNGSGEWRIVPGEMRYITASGRRYIWGIAPNDSLYSCEKPCTGDWQYVGGCFRQIEAGNNKFAYGVTITNITLQIGLFMKENLKYDI